MEHLPNSVDLNEATNILSPQHGGTGLSTSGTDSTKVLKSDGAGGWVLGTGGGGSSSPFPTSQQFLLTALKGSGSFGITAADPLNRYVYVDGLLVSNNDYAIVQIDITTGATQIWDSGSTDAQLARYTGIRVSRDGNFLYFGDATNWYKVQTSIMSTVQHLTLANPIGNTQQCSADLSSDGGKFAYLTCSDQNVHLIDTSTYAVTSFAVGHSAASPGSPADVICFDSAASSNVWVGYTSSVPNITLDKYSIAGVYQSSVTVPNLPATNDQPRLILSGINGSLFVATTDSLYTVFQSGSPVIQQQLSSAASWVTTDTQSPQAVNDGLDMFVFITNGGIYEIDNFGNVSNIIVPQSVGIVQSFAPALLQDGSGRFAAVTFPGGSSVPVWLVDGLSTAFSEVLSDFGVSVTTAGKGIRIKTGTNAKVGTGTLTAGAATIANTSVTVNSLIFVTNTGSNTGLLAVTSQTAGVGFHVASSNAADISTFGYFIMEMM